MSTSVTGTSRLLTTEREAQQARGVVGALQGPEGFLLVGREGAPARQLPDDLGVLLQHVLEAVASGSSVTVSAIPPELTTSSAASILGVSRPTLMKMIRDEAIPAHMVGTHTRLKASDVLAARRARRARERAAFEELLKLEDDEDS